MANAIRLNHDDHTIIITKDFAKKSGIPGSNEYKELMNIKRDNRDYNVVVKATTKRNDGTSKITKAKMRAYISKHDDENGTIMAQFKAMVDEEVGENLNRTSFFAIKKWFFEQYSDLKPDTQNAKA
jgi:hypothetical protein